MRGCPNCGILINLLAGLKQMTKSLLKKEAMAFHNQIPGHHSDAQI